ncbi:MAG TPA: hypothetical protein VF160_14420 [Candidatus Dormibacteraeota bacterium]
MLRRIPTWSVTLAVAVLLVAAWIVVGGWLSALGGLHDPSHCGGG